MNKARPFRLFPIVNGAFLVALCLLMIYPIVFVLGRSFMSSAERALRPLSIVPTDPDLTAYRFLFMKGSYIFNSYIVTVSRTVAGTFFNLLFSSAFAYVLSKRYYPLRVPLTFMVIFTMWFNGGLVPTYLLIRSLGLMNNFLVYILPGLISAWNLLILRNFFMAIPDSVDESARIDGANDFVILFRIILPLSSAALATIGLFYAVGHWNAWFDALMYMTDRKLWTVQVFLREILHNVQAMDLVDPASNVEQLPAAEAVQMATIVVATVPILCVYPFLQKYFVKGVMVGSLKG
jgi:putative aldouronate transport system permease protein